MMTQEGDYRRILARLGYYDYQQGLIVRNMKQKGGWEDHLSNCRSFILDEVERTAPSKVTVLGSGWLLDLPLAELTDRVDEIVLVDIVHPPQVKQQTACFPNVKLVEEDVSGGLIAEVWKKVGKRFSLGKLDNLDDLLVPVYRMEEPGMVVSLNILTQLEVLPLRLIEKKSKVDNNRIMEFRMKIQNNHLKTLMNHHSLMIADVKEVFLHSDGVVTEDKTLLVDIPEEVVLKRWRWDFDMLGIDFYGKKSYMEVIACKL